ncbi:MAG: bis(5'-nucleosyl)-tetraphosphatase (symmetrical) YqeK [Oscillospiraceae bacterium]
MFDEKCIQAYDLLLKKLLSKKRYIHSLNVAFEAVKLAEKYGADSQKAYTAGLLHDICKEMSADNQRQLVMLGFDVCQTELNAQPLWHAVAGAVYVKNQLGITDDDIINSIRYHTTGRSNMSLLEQIIYLADLISADRDYKEVKKMRVLAYTDLSQAMLEAFKFGICDHVSKGNSIPLKTVEAYNFFTGKI